jgi:hypothetical protein
MGRLFVGDHLAKVGDVLLDSGYLVGPGACGGIGVGDAGGVLPFGLGENLEGVVKSFLQGGAGHVQKPTTPVGREAIKLVENRVRVLREYDISESRYGCPAVVQ